MGKKPHYPIRARAGRFRGLRPRFTQRLRDVTPLIPASQHAPCRPSIKARAAVRKGRLPDLLREDLDSSCR